MALGCEALAFIVQVGLSKFVGCWLTSSRSYIICALWSSGSALNMKSVNILENWPFDAKKIISIEKWQHDFKTTKFHTYTFIH
jgi:hypothetical protein